MFASGVGRAERGIARVGSLERFSRGPRFISTESWRESTGVILPMEPGESRAYSSLNTFVLDVLDELRLKGCCPELTDPSLETGCGAIGAVHPPTLDEMCPSR